MKKEAKPGDFIQKPKYIGGKAAWRKLLKENLKYPAKALENKIEGTVSLSYEVNGNGKVMRPKVTKGIGYGCDEEAIRIVKMMKYENVSNRKVKIISHHKIAIQFKLPKPKPKPKTQHLQYRYTLKPTENNPAKNIPAKTPQTPQTPTSKPKKEPKKSYTYTIKF